MIDLKSDKIISIGKQGFILIDLKNLRIPSFQDQLYINRISNTDTSILINENNSQVKFNSIQNSFSVNFGVLSPPNSYLYEMSYKLEGFDNDWIIDKEDKKRLFMVI